MNILPESRPQQGPALADPGVTARTWDPARAARFPADAACTDEQLLEKWLAAEGLTAAGLEKRGCRQLVLSAARKPGEAESLLCCYERKEDGRWAPALPRMAGHNGRKGVVHDRKKDTDTSPAGLWPLGTAFGNSPRPEGLKMPWRSPTPETDWVCDPASPYYNTWQERDDPALTASWDHSDVEHLADYVKAYAYACVIGFNMAPYTVTGRGCAIFFHCSTGGTAGCIGLEQPDMLRVLRWLDPEKRPHILITGAAE